MNRRKFIHDSGCAAIGGSTLLSSIMNLSALNASAGYHNTSDFKALVCILLAGGNDSFNMLIPKGSSEYQEYQTVRGGLAIPNNDILSLNNGTNNNRELGLHPVMSNVKNIYNIGDAAFISNVGSLVEPVNLNQYQNASKKLPLGLFSHVDEIAHWQTSIPQERGSIGWGGRMADLLNSVNTNQNISMSISLSGGNLLQTGDITRPFTLTANGAVGVNGYNGMSTFDQIRTNALDSLLGGHHANLFERTYKEIVKNSNDANLNYDSAVANTPPLQTSFSSNNATSQELKVVAETIAAREGLQMSRQIFFITIGGWDHHDEVLNSQASKLNKLDTALSEFYSALAELNVKEDVTTFTISDFGRTLTSNGNGSDHAWGGNALVMGGAVNGNNIYGQYPDLYLNNPLDVGRGRLIPTLAADEYLAELAIWFGVPKSELDIVFPNIHAFYDVTSSTSPIGYLED